ISDAGELMDCGTVNVSAQDRVDVKLIGVADDRFLEFADEANCVFDALFRVGAERPVTETEPPSDKIDRRIEREQKLVSGIAQISEPLRILNDGVELMSVNHENAATISRDVNRVLLNRNVSVSAAEGADELIVISGNVNHRHALARFAQDFLDHVVVLLRPIATAPQLPDIDQIANDVEFLAIVIAQKLKHRLGVARPCSEMKIGDPGRTNMVE